MLTLFIAAYVLLGCLAGFLSGLLGTGGGIIVVPGLVMLFLWHHMLPQYVMQMAAGTSFAVMIFTTGRSLQSHLKYKVDAWPIVKRMIAWVIVGAVSGVVVAHHMHSDVLKQIFGGLVLFVAIQLMFSIKFHLLPLRSTGGWFYLGSLCIGLIAGLLGIGGSVFTIPFLLQREVTMRQAVVVAVSLGSGIAVFGFLTAVITGTWVHLPMAHHWGYVYYPAALAVAVGSVLMAPWGAKLSHRLPSDKLRKVFAIYLLIVAVHMLV